MATLAIARQRKPMVWLKQLIIRHPLTAFLVLTYTCAWGSMVPLLLSKNGFGILPIELPVHVFQWITSFVGLLLPAFLVTAAIDGKAGVLNLLRRCFRWRVGLLWYLLALFMMLFGVIILALPFFGPLPLQMAAQKWQSLMMVFISGITVPFLLINLPEEITWTGFLQAKLQDRHGPLLASLLTAAPFALVHLPPFFIDGWLRQPGLPPAPFLAILLSIGIMAIFGIFFRLVIMWLYNGSGESLLIVGLFHSAFNVVNNPQIMGELIPNSETESALPLAVIAIAAVLVTIVTKGRLAHRLEHKTPTI